MERSFRNRRCLQGEGVGSSDPKLLPGARQKLLQRRDEVQRALSEARSLVETGRFHEALERYESALDWATGPKRASYYEEIGKLHLQLGHFAEAFQAYSEAVRLYHSEGEADTARSLVARMARLEAAAADEKDESGQTRGFATIAADIEHKPFVARKISLPPPPALSRSVDDGSSTGKVYGEAATLQGAKSPEAESDANASALDSHDREVVEAFHAWLGEWGQQVALWCRDAEMMWSGGRRVWVEPFEEEVLIHALQKVGELIDGIEQSETRTPRWACALSSEGAWIWFGSRRCAAVGLVEHKALGMTLNRARALAMQEGS
jgi:tetratricopeptide (TPR) repeat protein